MQFLTFDQAEIQPFQISISLFRCQCAGYPAGDARLHRRLWRGCLQNVEGRHMDGCSAVWMDRTVVRRICVIRKYDFAWATASNQLACPSAAGRPVHEVSLLSESSLSGG